jgi:hypothetical protein
MISLLITNIRMMKRIDRARNEKSYSKIKTRLIIKPAKKKPQMTLILQVFLILDRVLAAKSRIRAKSKVMHYNSSLIVKKAQRK